ncbi:hypothetical protein [Flintibacter muris]|uniref:hypothetical protein n=1 Tax=Flintibacter muris TaxID=2941327 RepID=UPI00203F1BF4|nr:hypothetical protein [Flintibacter muris]
MTYQELLMDLEAPVNRIRGGINAIGIMTMGLAQVQDPYTDGFNVVWNYLVDAERDLRRCIASKEEHFASPSNGAPH